MYNLAAAHLWRPVVPERVAILFPKSPYCGRRLFSIAHRSVLLSENNVVYKSCPACRSITSA